MEFPKLFDKIIRHIHGKTFPSPAKLRSQDEILLTKCSSAGNTMTRPIATYTLLWEQSQHILKDFSQVLQTSKPRWDEANRMLKFMKHNDKTKRNLRGKTFPNPAKHRSQDEIRPTKYSAFFCMHGSAPVSRRSGTFKSTFRPRLGLHPSWTLREVDACTTTSSK